MSTRTVHYEVDATGDGSGQVTKRLVDSDGNEIGKWWNWETYWDTTKALRFTPNKPSDPAPECFEPDCELCLSPYRNCVTDCPHDNQFEVTFEDIVGGTSVCPCINGTWTLSFHAGTFGLIHDPWYGTAYCAALFADLYVVLFRGGGGLGPGPDAWTLAVAPNPDLSVLYALFVTDCFHCAGDSVFHAYGGGFTGSCVNLPDTVIVRRV